MLYLNFLNYSGNKILLLILLLQIKIHHGYKTHTVHLPDVLGQHERPAEYRGRRFHPPGIYCLLIRTYLPIRIPADGRNDTQPVPKPYLYTACFLYRDHVEVHRPVQRDHTGETIIPGYRDLFPAFRRPVGKSIFQGCHGAVASLPEFPVESPVCLHNDPVVERDPPVEADVHADADTHKTIAAVPAQFHFCDPDRSRATDAPERDDPPDPFRGRLVYRHDVGLRNRAYHGRCGNHLHTYRTYHHYDPDTDRRDRGNDLHQFLRPLLYGTLVVHQQTGAERYAERGSYRRAIQSDPEHPLRHLLHRRRRGLLYLYG